MEYKNPFEDPDADLYGKKIKDYKIVERKEEPEQKPAEPLEKKVESEAQKRVLESLKKEYGGKRSFLRNCILYGAISAGEVAYGIIRNEGAIFLFGGIGICVSGIVIYYFAVPDAKESKGRMRALEKKLTKEA